MRSRSGTPSVERGARAEPLRSSRARSRAPARSARRRAPARARSRCAARRRAPPTAPGASPSAGGSRRSRVTPRDGRAPRAAPAARARSAGQGPRSHVTGSDGTPSAVRNSKYWSCTCCGACGGIRRVVNSQFRSRARARSKPSFSSRAQHRRHEPGLDVHLEREHEVEAPAGRARAGRRAARASPRDFLEDDDLIDPRMPAHERRRPRLQDPRDVAAPARGA